MLEEKHKCLLASYATLNDFYIENLLCGAASKEEAVDLVDQLKKMLKNEGFNLRSQKSNIPQFVEEYPDQKQMIPINSDGNLNVLRIS